MDWLQIFILGLISGLTEFLPLSAPGHQRLLMHLFGRTETDPLCRFMLTLGALAAVVSACSVPLRRLMLVKRMSARRARSDAYENLLFDARIIKSVAIPAGIVYAVVTLLRLPIQLPFLVIAFALNGLFLFLLGNTRQANKTSRHMSRLDTIALSALGCASAIPGISLLGAVTSAGIARGAQRQTALSWALLISVPLLIVRMVIDLILLMLGGTSLGLAGFFCSIGGAVLSYCGSLISIRFVRYAVNRSGLSGFCYYAWSAALLTFILYLIT